MKLHSWLVGMTTLSFLVTAQADTLSPEPEPGLWRREAATLINGEDIHLAIRNTQEQMLQTLPADQRKVMEQMMNPGGAPGVEMECITPQIAADLTDPEALIKRAQKDTPDCSMAINKVSGSTMAIAGSCAGNEGYSGEMQGELTIVSSREMRSTFSGTGTMKMENAAALPPTLQGTTGEQPVTIEHNEISTWLSDDCAGLEPRQ